jgi:hypothetical protein
MYTHTHSKIHTYTHTHTHTHLVRDDFPTKILERRLIVSFVIDKRDEGSQREIEKERCNNA